MARLHNTLFSDIEHFANTLESAFAEGGYGSTSILKEKNTNFPPNDIVQVDELTFEVSVALAGYKEEDIKIDFVEGNLKISSEVIKEQGDKKYIHKGIANRAFALNFKLRSDTFPDSAEFIDGLLTVRLKRIVPEQLKSRSIKIGKTESHIEEKPKIEKSKEKVEK